MTRHRAKESTRRESLLRGGGAALGLLGARYIGSASPAAAQGSGSARRGVIVQSDDIVSLDPRKQRAMHNEVVIMAAAEKLVRMNREGALEGHLAVKCEPIRERAWRFHLRRGVRFHNGVDFKADALKAWMDVYRAQSLSRDRVDAIDDIAIVDDYTIDFNTKYPYPLLPYQLNAIGAIAEPGWAAGPSYSERTVVGTGPYKVVDWAKGQRVRFDINPEWWGWKGDISRRLPSLDFRPIAESSTRVAALLTGEADIVRGVPAQDIRRVRASDGAAVETIAGNRCMNIFLRDDIPPTNDVRVRRALNHAVDIEAIIRALHGGNAVKLQGQPVGPSVIGFNPNLGAYPHDPAKARQLLREAGYPNGFDIKFDTSAGRYEKDVEVSNAIAGMLAKIGVRAEVVINETAEYAAKYARSIPYANMFFWASGNIVPEAENAFNDLLPRPGQKEPTSGFHSAELAAIQNELKQTLNTGKRKALAHAGMEIIHREAPMLFLYQQVDIYGRRKNIDWSPRTDEWILADEISIAA